MTPDHQRHHGQHEAGEGHAEAKHRKHDEAEGEDIADDGHDARSEHVVQCIHVGGDAGDQTSHRVAVVVREIERLQMRHQIAAQIEHGPLAGLLHEPGLAEVGEERAYEREEEQSCDLAETRIRPALKGAGRATMARRWKDLDSYRWRSSLTGVQRPAATNRRTGTTVRRRPACGTAPCSGAGDASDARRKPCR